MVVHEDIVIDGKNFVKYYSNENFKIRCDQDMNIYPVAYVLQGSTVTFTQTNQPLNEITPGHEISACQIVGLKDFVEKTVDVFVDDNENNQLNIDLGGA